MVEKVSKIYILFNLKIFVGMILNFCAMIFFQALDQLISYKKTDR